MLITASGLDGVSFQMNFPIHQPPMFVERKFSTPLVKCASHVVAGVRVETCRRAMGRPAEFSTEVSLPTLFVYHDARPRQSDARLHGRPARTVRTGVGRLTILAPGERLSGVLSAGGTYQYSLLQLGPDAAAASGKFRSRLAEDDPLLVHLASRLVQEIAGPSPESLLIESLRRSLDLLLAGTGQVGADFTGSRGILTTGALRRVCGYVEDQLHHNLKLDELAAVGGVSADHFGRLFRAATGRTPHQYLTWRRVERAKHLLMQTELGLAEIAAATGFCDQSHLHRRFKAVTGLSPAEFRRRVG